MKTELEIKKSTELEVVDVFAGLAPGASFEDVAVEDVAIPFLRIIQALSGEVKRGAKYVENASVGDIFLTAVSRVYPGETGVRVIPCAFRKAYTERVVGVIGPAGFVRSHATFDMSKTIRSEDGKYDVIPNGNHIQAAAHHFVIVVDGNEFIRAIISFTSTQRKKSRAWLAGMGALKYLTKDGLRITPPSFAHSYVLTTGEETKDSNSWQGWIIGRPEPVVDRLLALEAVRFYKDVMGGSVKAQDELDEGTVAEKLPF